MKTSKNNLYIFKGAGILYGIGIGLVSALVVFVIAGNIAAAISASVPVGVTTAIALEQRFQNSVLPLSPAKIRNLIVSLGTGIIIFFIIYLLSRLS